MSDIYLVDDHPLMLDGLRAVLHGGGHRVIGAAAGPTQALADIERLAPALMLLDVHLGERSGFELLTQLQRRKSAARCIVLSVSAQPRQVAEAPCLGALGYVLNGASGAELIAAFEPV